MTDQKPRAGAVPRRRSLHLRDSLRQSLGLLAMLALTLLGQPQHPWYWIGVVAACGGLLVRLWASGYIVKNQELATGGPYAFVRHPLYVGNLLLTVGFCFASGLWWSFPLMLVFWVVFYPTAVRVEDEKLRRLFGEAWEAWRTSTRALVPSLRPYADRERASWSFWQSLRANGEPIIAFLLLSCLAWLHRGLPG